MLNYQCLEQCFDSLMTAGPVSADCARRYWAVGQFCIHNLEFGGFGTHNSGRAGSRTFRTLSTAIGESRLEYCDTTLLLSDLHGQEPYCRQTHNQVQLAGGCCSTRSLDCTELTLLLLGEGHSGLPDLLARPFLVESADERPD